jgi:hypothetical protein
MDGFPQSFPREKFGIGVEPSNTGQWFGSSDQLVRRCNFVLEDYYFLSYEVESSSEL